MTPTLTLELNRRRGRCQGLLFEVETVGHIVRGLVAGVDRPQAKRVLAEFHEAHVGVLGMRDVPALCIRAEDQAPHARPVAELGAVLPLLDQRRGDVVVPATPVVPRDEDDGVGPQPTLDDRVDLVGRPFLPGLDRLDRVPR